MKKKRLAGEVNDSDYSSGNDDENGEKFKIDIKSGPTKKRHKYDLSELARYLGSSSKINDIKELIFFCPFKMFK